MSKTQKPVNAPQKARRGPPANAWRPGESGNPAGRPLGARNRATTLAEAVLEQDLEAIAKIVATAALGGDLQAARMILERLVPQRRERAIEIGLPSIEDLGGVSEAQAAILAAVACGDLLLGEATALSEIVERRRRSIEAQELEKRITELERRNAQ